MNSFKEEVHSFVMNRDIKNKSTNKHLLLIIKNKELCYDKLKN